MKGSRLTVRQACRSRMPLDGADAQALEHALTITERERDALLGDLRHLRKAAMARAVKGETLSCQEIVAFVDGAARVVEVEADTLRAVEPAAERPIEDAIALVRDPVTRAVLARLARARAKRAEYVCPQCGLAATAVGSSLEQLRRAELRCRCCSLEGLDVVVQPLEEVIA